ncbi:hypothetical protein [Arthrobacter sp. M4]|uniref:hypothetical protein n=1 Tax=Arthrobacter sp. M4 TaxID=218160 RepID=UPI001CDB7F89|nr:hypothetical protein [Arthrobacter sp. M4]MCA4134475.1 hypothetical protein [Arthrobacter sp. M4]
MNRVQRGKLVLAAAAVGVGLLSVTGCGYINAQQTTHQYAASDGIREDFGPFQLRNIVIVSEGEGKPGRVIGAVYNTSKSDATLTIKGSGGSQTSVSVKAGAYTLLNDSTDAATLSNAGGKPGSLAPVTLSAPGTSAREIKVPVMDGTLAEYKTYLPTPSATPTSTSTSTSTGSPTSTSTAHATATAGH